MRVAIGHRKLQGPVLPGNPGPEVIERRYRSLGDIERFAIHMLRHLQSLFKQFHASTIAAYEVVST